MKISTGLAKQSLVSKNNGKTIGSKTITETLQKNRGVTFANIVTVTPVKTAAKFKELNIQKVTQASVYLAAYLNQDTNLYLNKVLKTSGVEHFVLSDTYYTHTKDCYSVVEHKNNGKQYLQCMYNSASSLYYIDGQLVDKKEVEQYLTPSELKKFTDTSGTVDNVRNDTTHTAQVRVIKLENIVTLNVNKSQLLAA